MGKSTGLQQGIIPDAASLSSSAHCYRHDDWVLVGLSLWPALRLMFDQRLWHPWLAHDKHTWWGRCWAPGVCKRWPPFSLLFFFSNHSWFFCTTWTQGETLLTSEGYTHVSWMLVKHFSNELQFSGPNFTEIIKGTPWTISKNPKQWPARGPLNTVTICPFRVSLLWKPLTARVGQTPAKPPTWTRGEKRSFSSELGFFSLMESRTNFTLAWTSKVIYWLTYTQHSGAFYFQKWIYLKTQRHQETVFLHLLGQLSPMLVPFSDGVSSWDGH